MNVSPDRRSLDRLETISATAALVVIAIGALVLAGWLFDLDVLKSVHPALVSMKANTAAGFVLSGISLWLAQTKRVDHRPGRYLAWGGAGLVAALGLLTLGEYALGWNWGIDQLLFHEPSGTVQTVVPGRMAPNTAFEFAMIGLALLLLDVRTRRGYRPAQYLIALIGIVSSAALVGYLYDASILYSPSAGATAMSLPAALAGVSVFVGLLFARPGAGLAALVASENAAGVMARRFLLPVLLLPLVLDFVLGAGQRAGLYGAPVAAAAHAVTMAGAFLAVVLVAAALG